MTEYSIKIPFMTGLLLLQLLWSSFLFKQASKRKGYVFLYQGKPMKHVVTAFKTACKRAGIPYGRTTPNGITFHDLRHSFGSLVQQVQGNIRITQQLMNHKTIQMTERYTHSRNEAKLDAVNRLNWGLHEQAATN